ncbi:hypothetical protein ACN469_31600 [Corallococcus terminator]
MARYTVRLDTAPAGHSLPPLLVDFGKWLGTQTYGSLGDFELIATAVPQEWNPKVAERLQRDAFCFLNLPDGSLLALLRFDAEAPWAVVLLGSEGESRTISSSLEGLLHAIAEGNTDISDIDDDGDGREALSDWLDDARVDVPDVADALDFNVYLSAG